MPMSKALPRPCSERGPAIRRRPCSSASTTTSLHALRVVKRLEESRAQRIGTVVDKPVMNRRRELRISSDQPVRITLLCEPRRQLDGRINDYSARGISIFTSEPVRPGDAIQIDLEDSLVLGEVRYWRAAERGYVVGIEIEEALHGLAALARLNQALLGNQDLVEGAPRTSFTLSSSEPSVKGF